MGISGIAGSKGGRGRGRGILGRGWAVGEEEAE